MLLACSTRGESPNKIGLHPVNRRATLCFRGKDGLRLVVFTFERLVAETLTFVDFVSKAKSKLGAPHLLLKFLHLFRCIRFRY